jgi:hypothetical protein
LQKCGWQCSSHPEFHYLPAVIEAPIVLKRPVSAPVIEGIAASKQTAIAEAIRPYSIAVAPDSSFKNLFILLSPNVTNSTYPWAQPMQGCQWICAQTTRGVLNFIEPDSYNFLEKAIR